MEFPRQEYWNRLPLPSPGDLLNPGIEPTSPLLQANSLLLSYQGNPSQALLSMGFPRQEYWSGLSFPSPGDFPNPGVRYVSPALAGGFFTGAICKALVIVYAI